MLKDDFQDHICKVVDVRTRAEPEISLLSDCGEENLESDVYASREVGEGIF